MESRDRPAHRGPVFGSDLTGKATCKADLLKEFGLPTDTQLPVVGIVSRFVQQKGFDLIQQVADRLALEDLILVVLGSGEREYEDMFRRLNKQYPQKFAVKIAYDNALAHKIEAGSDMFLMPSHYEPCGLNQIYSLQLWNRAGRARDRRTRRHRRAVRSAER